MSFRADWLRCEEAMETAGRENRTPWAAVRSIRADGTASQNRSGSSTLGWKQKKLQRSWRYFLLTSPSIEHSEMPTYQELGLRILVVLMKGVSALSDSTFCFCAAASLYKSSVALKGDTDEALLSSRYCSYSIYVVTSII
jgi:hypothetical protein